MWLLSCVNVPACVTSISLLCSLDLLDLVCCCCCYFLLSPLLSFPLSLSLTHTHTHTHFKVGAIPPPPPNLLFLSLLLYLCLSCFFLCLYFCMLRTLYIAYYIVTSWVDDIAGVTQDILWYGETLTSKAAVIGCVFEMWPLVGVLVRKNPFCD